MKAGHSSKQTKPGRHSLYHPAAACRAETVAFVTLGIVALVAILLAVVAGSVLGGANETSTTALEKLPVVHYLYSGQMKADAHTAAEIVLYYFQPEDATPTNTVSAPAVMQKPLAVNTNSTLGSGSTPL